MRVESEEEIFFKMAARCVFSAVYVSTVMNKDFPTTNRSYAWHLYIEVSPLA